MRDMRAFNEIVRTLRRFFQDEYGFMEVPAQSRLSILAACEDPRTITQFVFSGINYPLPQTGQMWLEAELLKNPKEKGVFCVTTSYRNEPFPIEGRHDKIFPMFEFESHGNLEALKQLETELIAFLGFKETPRILNYEDMCHAYSVDELGAAQETRMQEEYGNIVFLQRFPQRSHPFWNMKHDAAGIFNKIDVLLYGMETIGSAERSTNVDEMRDNFHTISDGQYATLLFSNFGRERVMKELEEYFSLPMVPRFGAGMGISRLARAMKLAGLIEDHTEQLKPQKSVIKPDKTETVFI